MKANQSTAFRMFKYSIYALLTLNIALFFVEEWAASAHRFADGVAAGDIIEGFAATIDTLAWVVLLLMFELETYVLEDRHFTPRVSWTLQIVRVVCYVVIVYAFFGYLSKLLFLFGASPASIASLCAVAQDGWVYAVDLDEYAAITVDNCSSLSQSGEYLRLAGTDALVDPQGYRDIVRLAWVDVINSGVWLGVVALLEFDVQMQSRGKLEGLVQQLSNIAKYVMYSILLLAAVYWGIKGDFVDFWDAFLWLVAFVFIELNVVEWREEDHAAAARAGGAAQDTA